MTLTKRAGSLVIAPLIRRRTLLSVGALAAGLAMVHKSPSDFPYALSKYLRVRNLVTLPTSSSGPWSSLPSLHRSQSSLSGLFSSLTLPDSTMAALVPPQAAPSWTHSAQDIVDITKREIEKHKAVEDRIAALSPSECNFQSVCYYISNL